MTSSINNIWMEEIQNVIKTLFTKRESELFSEPVPWESLGLFDYLDIVKVPMDLGTVLKNLENKKYLKIEDCVADIRLIWNNSLLYNLPGSKVYTIAKYMSTTFEQLINIKDDDKKPPNCDELTIFGENCHKISSDNLGLLMIKLDKMCPQCLTKNSSTNSVDVNLDLIDRNTFEESIDFMKTYIPDILNRRVSTLSKPNKKARI